MYYCRVVYILLYMRGGGGGGGGGRDPPLFVFQTPFYIKKNFVH